MRTSAMVSACAVAGVVGLGQMALANVFDMPSGQKSLEFVTVGDPGNAGDPDYHGVHGAVSYTYQMGTYDVTAGQYCQFLNAVAATDTYGLYNANMANPASYGMDAVGCGIVQSGSSGSYTYSVARDPNLPVNWVSWGSAARFCNWLTNGQPMGTDVSGTTEAGSYTLNGARSISALNVVTRNPGTKYVIPTDDEWYKAAYYKGGGTNVGYWSYPMRSIATPSNVLSSTGTNNANYWDYYNHYTDPTNYLTPVGYFASSPGPYGTFDMGGNVWQWTERHSGGNRVIRGSSFANDHGYLRADGWGYYDPSGAGSGIGFRVALVPEPATLALLSLGGLAVARRASRGRTELFDSPGTNY